MGWAAAKLEVTGLAGAADIVDYVFKTFEKKYY